MAEQTPKEISEHKPNDQPHKEKYPLSPWAYDTFLWAFSVIFDLFFREIHPRGAWKVPRRGPVIFVAAPHANQFCDPIVLMRVLRREAHRRVSFLIAAKSMSRKFIGWGSRQVGSVPVARAQDMAKPADGRIYLPDPIDDPLLLRGVGTNFEEKAQVGGLIILPTAGGTAASAEIAEINGPEEIRLKKPFKGFHPLRQLTGRDDVDDKGNFENKDVKGTKDGYNGINYKLAPKVDQSEVYEAVFDRLKAGGAVGIFPEGGSHDRPELLPLKAGVAIMALGALAANPDSNVQIVPCGMNYFHAHKFRSRAVVEFGNPIEVPKELVTLYKDGHRREAVGQLLETVHQALLAVTVTTTDYDTLMTIQAARRLYNPVGKKLPLPMVVELNRRLIKGYQHYKDDPRIMSLKQAVTDYNKQLRYMNLRDHQVEYARFSIPEVLFLLVYRLLKISILSIGVLPGLILFAPVFIATKIISNKKSKEALAASTVKLEGRDVIATWKVLVALAFAPILYNFYTWTFTYWTYRNRVQGYIPDWVPLWAVVLSGYIIFPAITYAALRFGEVGMDIIKSLRPLVLALNPTSNNSIHKLRLKREELSLQVTEMINTLGPEMFPDFDHKRIIVDPFHDHSHGHSRNSSSGSMISDPSDLTHSPPRRGSHPDADNNYLPRNESLKNLGSIGLFSTRPGSRSRSRSRSTSGGGDGGLSFPIKSFKMLNSKSGFEEVSSKIRDAMRERGVERQRRASASTNTTSSRVDEEEEEEEEGEE